MSEESYFWFTSEKKEEVLDILVREFPEEKREDTRTTASELMTQYEGQDYNVLGVLHRAAENGRFDEYVERLQAHYEEHVTDISPEDRRRVAGKNLDDLRYLLKRKRMRPDPADMRNFPKKIQDMVQCPEAMELELYFESCYREIMD